MEKSGRLFHPPANGSSKGKPSGGRSSRAQLVQPRYCTRRCDEGVGGELACLVVCTREPRFAGNTPGVSFVLKPGASQAVAVLPDPGSLVCPVASDVFKAPPADKAASCVDRFA